MTIIGLRKDDKQPVDIDLPNLIETRLLIQANSGGGKSWLLRRLLEQTNGKVQQIVLDLEGEFATLREKHDYVLAGKEGDIPVNIKVAPVLARRLMELKTSAIIDLYELKHHERILFVKRFLDALINLPKNLWHPCLVIIDEAHIFCPEKGKAESMGSVIDLCTRGRKRGLCSVLASQRLSKLHKDAAAECNNKLIGRTGLDIDRKRAGDELGFSSKADTLKLRDLDPGHFFAFGPAISRGVTEIVVGNVQTSHPKVGSRALDVPPPATAKVMKALQGLIDLGKEADEELRTTEDFKRKIREIKLELRKKPKAHVDGSAMQRNIEITRKRAFSDGQKESQKEINEIRHAFKKAHRDAERHYKQKVLQVKKEYEPLARKLNTSLNGFREIGKIVNKYTENQVKFNHKTETPISALKPFDSYLGKTLSEKKVPKKDVVKIKEPKEPDFFADEDSEFVPSNPQKVILNTLAQFKAVGLIDVPKKMVAGFSRVRPTSGAYSNNLGRLRSAGFIDYRKPGHVYLCDAGEDLVGEISDVPATSDELQDRWKSVLSGPRSRILDYLISIYPESVAKEELGEQLDVSPTSGAYSNNLGAMRTLGIIDYPEKGVVKATKMLFIEEINQ